MNGGSVTLGVWWKLASASEPGSHVFSWGSNQEAYGWIMRFTGQDVAPIDAVAIRGGSSANPISPSVNSTVADALILRLGGFDDDDVSVDNPGLPGHTAITMDQSSGGGGTTSGGAGFVAQPAPGPSGTSNFSLTGWEQYRTVTIAIAPAPAGPHFAISHDGNGSTCLVEPVTITAHAAGHGIDAGYAGTVSLSTDTGNGDWSLITGSGTLTNLGGGAGTYTFAGADAGVVVLGLADTVPETVDIDVTDGSQGEVAGEDPSLVFSSTTSTDTVRDQFSGVSYLGNDGSVNWNAAWLERDDDGSPASGNVRVIAGEVSMEDFPNTDGDPSLEREADLTGATSATFSFDWRTTSGVDANDSVFIEVSDDGGSSWTILENMTGISGAQSGTRSYDVSAFISANTRVRFRVNGLNGTGGTSCCYGASGEQFLVDDVEISFSQPLACGADHFTVSHDGSGINCLTEPVDVTARDAVGAVVTTYAQPITLDTQSGSGTWSLITGAGTFVDAVANDGVATYSYDPTDLGVASFGLDYPQGAASLDVDSFESAFPGVRDDDSEGPLVFGPSGFTVTASALGNPPPNPINDPVGPEIAGTDFTLHISAFGQTPTDPQCGVIEAYDGARSLAFWSSYLNPGSGTLAPTVDGLAIAGSEAAATPQAVAFSNGQAQVTTRYKDVGQIRIDMKDEAPSEPVGGIRGATNPFVVTPADFVIIRVARTDATPNPGTSSPSAPFFVAAGEAFEVDVEAIDAQGDLVPNYGNETPAQGLILVASTLVEPVGGRNGSANDGAIGNGTAFSPLAPAGTFTGGTFFWDEVGAVRLTASVDDADYLGAGDVTGSESGIVGRFTPHHFDVALNAPLFTTGCSAGAFTYMDQPFGFAAGAAPAITLTARSLAGTVTRNYTGAWWRLTNTSLTGRSYAAATGALDPSGLPLPSADPAIVDAGNGTGTLTFSSGTGLRFTRAAPVAPFDAEISLQINVIDEDLVAHAGNPVVFGQPTPGNGIAFSTGKAQRYGRLRIENAHGSELVALGMPLYAEYFDGAGFVTNIADACTSIAAGNLNLTANPPGLPTVPTIANTPLLLGDAGLVLSAPGAGNTGYVDVGVDLSGLPWLRYDWPADGTDGVPDDDPQGRATFGIFGGDDAMIYLREVY